MPSWRTGSSGCRASAARSPSSRARLSRHRSTAAPAPRRAEPWPRRAGNPISRTNPRAPATPFGVAPRQKAYKVAAVFEIGMSEFDATFVFMPLAEAQPFFNREDDVNLVEVFLDNADRVDAARTGIEQ